MNNFLGIKVEFCDLCEYPFIRCFVCNMNTCGGCGCSASKETRESWYDFLKDNRKEIDKKFAHKQRITRQNKIKKEEDEILKLKEKIEFCEDRISRYKIGQKWLTDN